MKKLSFITLFILFLTIKLFAQTTQGKWGVSACLSPWNSNREFTISRSLSDFWTLVFWGEFTSDKNEIAGKVYSRIDDGYSWSVGPEIRRKLY